MSKKKKFNKKHLYWIIPLVVILIVTSFIIIDKLNNVYCQFWKEGENPNRIGQVCNLEDNVNECKKIASIFDVNYRVVDINNCNNVKVLKAIDPSTFPVCQGFKEECSKDTDCQLQYRCSISYVTTGGTTCKIPECFYRHECDNDEECKTKTGWNPSICKEEDNDVTKCTYPEPQINY